MSVSNVATEWKGILTIKEVELGDHSVSGLSSVVRSSLPTISSSLSFHVVGGFDWHSTIASRIPATTAEGNVSNMRVSIPLATIVSTCKLGVCSPRRIFARYLHNATVRGVKAVTASARA